MMTQDQLGRNLYLQKVETIVCLVPSISELLCDLGLESKIIGVTKFCVHPPSLKGNASPIGGTKNPNIQKIKELNPDIVFANKEENNKQDIELLSEFTNVFVTDVYSLSSMFEMILEIAKIFDKTSLALKMIEKVKSMENKGNSKKAVYLIWKKPYMCAGKDTFIHAMMEYLGYENVITQDRYPELTKAQLQSIHPEEILLSSEPYPFKMSDVEEIQQICPKAIVRLVDGEVFSWYGSRLLHKHSIELV